MADNDSGKIRKLSKTSIVDVIAQVCVGIVALSLLLFIPRVRSPWSIILTVDVSILVLLQFLLLKRILDEREKIERNNTFLEWEEPRGAWHVTEASSFSRRTLVLWFAMFVLSFFSLLVIAMKNCPPINPNKDPLAFFQLAILSVGLGAFGVILYGSMWWWARVKVKVTTLGIQRTFHNQTKTWKYDRIKSYYFEPLQTKSNIYTLFILRNHKGKTYKIALDDSIDKTKLEEILSEHGIPKLDQPT
jgi:hypothetical protein